MLGRDSGEVGGDMGKGRDGCGFVASVRSEVIRPFTGCAQGRADISLQDKQREVVFTEWIRFSVFEWLLHVCGFEYVCVSGELRSKSERCWLNICEAIEMLKDGMTSLRWPGRVNPNPCRHSWSKNV